MKKTLLASALLACFPAYAATYYACPCDTGAQPGCVAGSDATATPTDPATPRNYFSAAFINSRAAGDRLEICQGGAKENAHLSGLVNSNATPTSPITISSYVASWGGAGVRPWLKFGNNSGQGFLFGYGTGESANDGGYVIENLKLDGGGSTNGVNYCIWTYNAAIRNFTIRDNEITGCGTAIYPGAFNHADPSPNTYFKIQRNNIHGNWYIGGIFGAVRHGLIEGNTFTSNGQSGGLAHHIYLGDRGQKLILRNNNFAASGDGVSEGTSSQCRGGNITVHGHWTGLHIIGNKIINESYNSTCAGIKVNTGYGDGRLESFDGVVIDGNTIVNVYVGIGLSAAHQPLIQNNVLAKIGLVGINIADTALEVAETPDFGATLLNNSFYFDNAADNPSAINLATNAGAGTGLTARGNLIRFATGAGIKTCFNPGALANFTNFERNGCSNEGGGTFRWSGTYSTLALAQAAGYDTNGQDSDPLVTVPTLANGWNMKLQSGSPALGASTGCPRLSFTGRTPTTCSIGAYQSVDP